MILPINGRFGISHLCGIHRYLFEDIYSFAGRLRYIVESLQSKNVSLVSLKENFNTSTPQGKFMLTIFAALAEFERETTLQRQSEGIAAARLAGKRFGRPGLLVPDNFNSVIFDWQSDKIMALEAMQKSGMKKTTFYKAVKKMKEA